MLFKYLFSISTGPFFFGSIIKVNNLEFHRKFYLFSAFYTALRFHNHHAPFTSILKSFCCHFINSKLILSDVFQRSDFWSDIFQQSEVWSDVFHQSDFSWCCMFIKWLKPSTVQHAFSNKFMFICSEYFVFNWYYTLYRLCIYIYVNYLSLFSARST